MYIEDLDNTEKLRAVIAESDILINATRAGMAPLQDVIPVPEDVLRPELAVADVVYNPLETLLVKKAKEAGCVRRSVELECCYGRELQLTNSTQDWKCQQLNTRNSRKKTKQVIIT